jgi:hypothetical protein
MELINQKSNDDSLVISYLTLRKTIGLLGASLPFLLYFGSITLFGIGLQPSVSSYYYTDMGDVFVGIICVIGFFLFSYRGYDSKNDIAGDLGCLFALGIALFPAHATPDGTSIVGYIHLGSAALFFGTLIYFCLFLFTKTDPERPPTPRKIKRNKGYRVCGSIMSLCILFITFYFLLPEAATIPIESYKPIFWFEAIAVLTFGISWLIKGEALLGDE